MRSNLITTRIARAVSALAIAAFLAVTGAGTASAAEQVRVSGWLT